MWPLGVTGGEKAFNADEFLCTADALFGEENGVFFFADLEEDASFGSWIAGFAPFARKNGEAFPFESIG